jgi:hypothetical protein
LLLIKCHISNYTNIEDVINQVIVLTPTSVSDSATPVTGPNEQIISVTSQSILQNKMYENNVSCNILYIDRIHIKVIFSGLLYKEIIHVQILGMLI